MEAAKKANSIRLACFDLDGTIIDETIFIWQTLHEYFGTDNEERRAYARMFFEGRISYKQWAMHDIMLWKQKGATKEKMLKALSVLRLMKGAIETLDELKKRGIKLAIISGSLDIALRSALPGYKSYFNNDDILINKIMFDEKGKIAKLKATYFDFKNKAEGLKKIAARHSIDISQTAFIGDHNNDIEAVKEAGLGIAFNSKSDELNAVADLVIEKKDLREVLKPILSFRQMQKL